MEKGAYCPWKLTLSQKIVVLIPNHSRGMTDGEWVVQKSQKLETRVLLMYKHPTSSNPFVLDWTKESQILYLPPPSPVPTALPCDFATSPRKKSSVVFTPLNLADLWFVLTKRMCKKLGCRISKRSCTSFSLSLSVCPCISLSLSWSLSVHPEPVLWGSLGRPLTKADLTSITWEHLSL